MGEKSAKKEKEGAGPGDESAAVGAAAPEAKRPRTRSMSMDAGGDPAAGDGPTDAQILNAVDAGALDNVPDPTESIEVGGMLG